jgi:hypothetical protein
MNLELGYVLAGTDGERIIQRMNAWEAPHLPGLDHSNMRRWATVATWVPPDSQILARHRSLDGSRCVVTNNRQAPDGFAIEYDLGLVHSFAQPGTKRLVASKNGYFCTPFEGLLDDGFEGLGYVEEAGLPMLEILELRQDPASGEQVLVAGADDPLYQRTTPIAPLGFIEGYPINPRHAPEHEIDWGIIMLRRSVDYVAWRHRYDIGEKRISGSVSLGGLWSRPATNLVPLYLQANGRLASDLLSDASISRRKLRAKLRWAAAPLSWPEGRPQSWAARAAASRARMLVTADNHEGPPYSSSKADTALGYVRRDHEPGWSPLFSATHPALADQYVTRSELEATDMGYQVDGLLGYVIDRFADRSSDALPREIKWASHFGQRRRYIEGFRP